MILAGEANDDDSLLQKASQFLLFSNCWTYDDAKKINTSKKKTEPYNEKGFPSLKHMLTKNFKNSGSLDEIKKRIAEATLIVSDLQENNLHYFENENLSKLKQRIKDLFVTNTNADAG